MDRKQVTDPEVRREAIATGAAWEYGLPPMSAQTVIKAAADAYSAAWEGSRHQVRDHQRALTAALAAVEPILAKIKRRATNPVAEARELIVDIIGDTVLPWRFHEDLPERVTVDVVMSSGTARIAITEHPLGSVHHADEPLDRREVVQALTDLLDRSGWQRLEIVRTHSADRLASGYCVDSNGQHLNVRDVLTERS